MLIQRQLKDEYSGEFWLTWISATLIGLVFGLMIGGVILNFVWPSPFVPSGTNLLTVIVSNIFARLIIVGLLVGASTGIMEWLVLRKYLSKSGWEWIVSNTVIWGLFPAIANALSSFLQTNEIGIQSVLTGSVIGIVQWHFMRRVMPKAAWWILARAVAGFFVFYTITPSPLIEISTIIRGLIAGAVTGKVLLDLLKQPITTDNLGKEAELQDRFAE